MNSAVVDELVAGARAYLRPREILTGSEWAERYGHLPPDADEPGPFRMARVPYLREPLDVVCSGEAERVVAMKGSQIGWTVGIYGMASGYFIHHEPSSILIYQPAEGDATAFSRDKLSPVIEASPVLREILGEMKSRDATNSTKRKVYPGGHIEINHAVGRLFRQRSAGKIFVDEVDAMECEEGDPISLIEKRTTTFSNPLMVIGSTPLLEESSRIAKQYDRSDRRRYYVPCPHCDHGQPMVWGGPDEDRGFKWDTELRDGRKVHVPGTIFYLCENCAAAIDERDKVDMIARGEWVAERPGAPVVGFHIPQFLANFHGTRWEALVGQWDNAYDDPEELQPFVNTVLAETWSEGDLEVEPTKLSARAESYPAEVPNGVAVLTAGVDVHPDRLELLVKGWGDREESWMIQHQRIYGDIVPSDADVWATLFHELTRPYVHESGETLRIRATMIDSGHETDRVYEFVRGKETTQRIYAVKGADSRQTEPLKRLKRPNRSKVKPWTVDTWYYKTLISRRLKLRVPKRPEAAMPSGFFHFVVQAPDATGGDEEYYAQFDSIKWETRIVRGKRVRAPVQARERDEAIDLEVYALAALRSLGSATIKSLGRIASELVALGETRKRSEKPAEAGESKKPEPPKAEETETKKATTKRKRRRSGGWADGWK